jgi:hypothetical protein
MAIRAIFTLSSSCKLKRNPDLTIISNQYFKYLLEEGTVVTSLISYIYLFQLNSLFILTVYAVVLTDLS